METEPRADIAQNSKYFLYIAIFFVTVLVVSNTVAVKLLQIGPLVLSGATLIFPISYIFGDILTEVYGYRASRKIIWSGFTALIFMSFIYWLVQMLPAPAFWEGQGAYETILGSVPRIVLGSIVAYFAGEFSNSYVLSRMKVRMNGKHLWARTIGSTVVGEGVDSAIFATIAFAGTLPVNALLSLIISIYLFKVAYEVAITPLTYVIVNKLKKAEGVDVYDKNISYNPFKSG
ncbi:MAG: queuosine precursor transporter [bacterium]|nr:queuosine precursor transporter [bacterium]